MVLMSCRQAQIVKYANFVLKKWELILKKLIFSSKQNDHCERLWRRASTVEVIVVKSVFLPVTYEFSHHFPDGTLSTEQVRFGFWLWGWTKVTVTRQEEKVQTLVAHLSSQRDLNSCRSLFWKWEGWFVTIIHSSLKHLTINLFTATWFTIFFSSKDLFHGIF